MFTVQEKITQLLWDRRIIIIPDDIERPPSLSYVILKDLTLEDRNIYLMEKGLEAYRCRLQGVPSEEEVLANYRQSGNWSEEDEQIEKLVDSHILFLESEFEAKKKFKARQNLITTQIIEAKEKKLKVQRKRSEMRALSSEYLAHEIASFILLKRVASRPDGKQLIANEKDLLYFKQNYLNLLYFIIQEMMSEGVLDLKIIREIARSSEWRITWTLCRENLSSIFNRTIGDLNLNHKLVIYWSRIYDSALESHEPPSFEIVQNDDLFDQWLADKDLKRTQKDDKTMEHAEHGKVLDGEYVEQCTCGSKELNKNKYLGERLPHAATCLYNTWRQYTPEEKATKARAIYSKNPESVRQLLSKEQDQIAARGQIEEQHLRKNKSREMLGMKTNVVPMRRR